MKKVIKVKSPNHMWTKQEIKQVIKMWEDSTPEKIAEEIGVTHGQVQSLAFSLRKSGIKVSKKRKTGYLRLLIEEVKNEINK